MQISGSGWYPNQTVTLLVSHADDTEPGGGGHEPFTTTTDADGNFTATWYVDGDDSRGSSFLLTADCAPEGMEPQTAITMFMDKDKTDTTVTSSLNPSVYTNSVTFTFTVSSAPSTPAPTGSVDVTIDGTTVATVALSPLTATSSRATYATSTLTGGTHSIKGEYNGDSNYNKSNNTITQTVNKANSSTAVVSSLNPSFQGQSVTFTATVTGVAGGATPTGTVTFKDGAATLGNGTLNGSGVATFATAALTAGSRSITAVYNADTNYNSSTSSTLTQVVNAKVNTTTTLTSDVNPANQGATVTFTATVTPASGVIVPTGTVTFKDGVATIGTGTLNGSGVATFATSSLSPGTHSITATYNGDTGNNTSTSAAVLQKIIGNTTTTAFSSQNPSAFGQSVVFSATVSATSGTPAGIVTFMDGAVVLGTSPLSGTSATFSTSALSVGAHSITAVYGGDPNYNGSTSSILTQTVNKANTTTSVVSSNNPAGPTTSITFTATVNVVSPGAGTRTGSVTFKDNGSTIGTGALSGNQATFTTTLAIGSHPITATYEGDANFNTSTSSTLNQVITDPSTSLTISSSNNPSVFNQAITITARLRDAGGSNLSGKTVTFTEGATTLGTDTTNGGGNAMLNTSSLSVGTHVITATFAGDATYTGSTVNISQVVNKTTATVTITNMTQTYNGTQRSVTVATNPAGLTVNVTYDGSPTAPTNAGTYAVVATINDANYQGSNTATLTVNKATATLSLSNLTATYDGNPHAATVTTNPVGLTGVSVTYNGSATAPTNAGSYAVVASLTNQNYQATNATGTLSIAKANATVNVTGGTFTYDTNPHPATATATGVNSEDLGAVTITYTPGGSSAPVNAGSYSVQANYAASTNYNAASGSASITINKADQTIDFAPLSDQHFGDPDVLLSATATSSLAVSFNVTAPATLVGNTMSFPPSGGTTATITVTASQAGNSNYNPATDVVHNFQLLENVKPTSSADVDPAANAAGWHKTPVAVKITATDNAGGDGVKEIRYTINGGTEVVVPGDEVNIPLNTDGTFNISFHAVDNAGNTEDAQSVTVKLDQTAPALTATPDRSPDSNGWYTAPLDITFSADDGTGSGVDNTTLTAPIHYDSPDSKVAFVEGDVSDIAGNATHKVFNFKYDATNPDILVAGLNGKGFESVSFDISASDHGSGADIHLHAVLKKEGVTVWTFDDTNTAPFAPTQSISGAANDGHYTLEVSATDEAGHVATYSKDFKIDNQAPVIEFIISPEDGGFYNTPQTITYTITDQDTPLTIVQTLLSMIASVDIGPVALTSGTTVSADGRYVVHLEATDCLGHSSDVTRTFTIDTAPPILEDAALSGTAAPNPAWFESDVNVTLSASDPDIRTSPTLIEGSGVKEMYYYATGAQPIGDSGNPVIVNGSTALFTINVEGVTTITYWTIDNAGNETSHKSVTVKYDKTKPAFDAISDIVTTADKPEGKDVSFTLPTPTDNIDADPTIEALPVSGTTFGVGTTTVTVTATDDAGQTFSTTFTVTVNNPAPVLSSISPDTKTYLDLGFTMTIHGDKFMPNSVVRMDGADRPTTFVSFTELTAEIPASDMSAAGTKTVTVFTPTPGGGTSGGATFTINKKAQAITFDTIADHTYGDAPLDVHPTSDSGLDVALSIVSGPATVLGNTITITGAGTVKVRASQAGNDNYLPADDVDQTFNVAKATPQISVTGGTFTYDGDPHPATGTLTGVNGDDLGDPVFEYTPGGSNAPVNAGTYSVKGSFAGNDNYNPVEATDSIIINKAHATLHISDLHYTYNGSPRSATVTTTPAGLSGVTVTYDGSTSAPTNAGSYAVIATLDNQNYEADPANETLVIDKADATVHITGGTFTYDGNPHPATATVTGVNNEDLGAVTITYAPGGSNEPVNAGDYTATGDFAGNQNYNPATANAPIKINKAHATITLSNLHYTYDGNTHAATATTSPLGLSGVTVTYDGGATLPLHAGSYAVQATLDNQNYEAAPANDTLVIDKADPTITVTGVHVTFDTNPHPATGSAKGVNNEDLGPLTFAYTPGGSTVPMHAGTYAVVGSFDGNDDYNPGSGNATVQIDKADQTINFGPLANRTYGDSAITLGANATSGLTVSFSLVSGPGTLVGNSLTLTGAGTIKVKASQAGNGDYNAAPDVELTFTVAKATPIINVTGGTFGYDGNGHAASATITGVNGDILPTPSISYSPNVTTPTNAGTYVATGSFAGNANYNPASGTANVVINKANLSVTADNKSKLLNAVNPPLTGVINGAVGTDGISATYSTTATQTSDVGNYPITPTLVDPNGKLSNYNVTVNNGTLFIGYKNNSGVLQPLNQDGSSVVKKNSTVPVKFQVFDSTGKSIGTPGVVTSFKLIQIIAGTVSQTVNEDPVSTTPDTEFRYDGQWIYNLNTKNLTAGQTYVYRITLKDGSYIDFRFGLK